MLLGNLVPECCPLIGHRYCLLIGQLMPRVTLSQESGVTRSGKKIRGVVVKNTFTQAPLVLWLRKAPFFWSLFRERNFLTFKLDIIEFKKILG